MRTGFTAACTARSAANAGAKRIKSRRLSSSMDSILLNRIFIQVEAQARKIGQVNVAVLDTEKLRRSHQFQGGRPLLLGKIRSTDDFLPFAIGHRATCL